MSNGSSSARSVDSAFPPLQPAETLGHGPFWISHIAYIQLSDDERTYQDTGPLTAVTHGIGRCPRTRYFCTGTCLNDIETDILLKYCVTMPNNAIFGHYMRPQFRTVATPPWVRTAVEQYFDYIESQLTDLVLANPLIY